MKSTFSALTVAVTLALASVSNALPMGSDEPTSRATDLLKTSLLEQRDDATVVHPSFNVTGCPGYKLVGKPKQTKYGIEAQLELAGEGCHAYGFDIPKLTLEVKSEQKHQLHVHLFDTDKNQF